MQNLNFLFYFLFKKFFLINSLPFKIRELIYIYKIMKEIIMQRMYLIQRKSKNLKFLYFQNHSNLL